MARARNIKPGFFKNEDLAEIEPLGRLLFAGLWTIADREGRLEDRPKRIKAELLPYDDCDTDNLLEALHSRGFILRYMAEGERFIAITAFDKHQNPHRNESDSVIPCPDIYGTDTDHGPKDFVPRTEALPEKDSTAPADSLFSDSLISESLSKHIVADPATPDPQHDQTGPEIPATKSKAKGKEKEFSPAGPEYKLATYLWEHVKVMDPKARQPNLQKWAADIDGMIRLDKRSPAEVKDMIDFVRKDPFWRKNILSAGTLRTQATKLTAQMTAKPRQGGTAFGTHTKPAGQGHEASSFAGFDASQYQYRSEDG